MPRRASAAPALVLRQLDELSRYLAACQLGITFTSLGIGFLGEPAVASTLIEEMFGEGVSHRVSIRRSRSSPPT